MKKEEMVAIITEGTNSLYNTVTGSLIITDLVDGGDREEEVYGIRAGNGDWMYGVMTCFVDPKDAAALAEEYGGLMEYALGCIPAPGTCAEDRMGFIAINSAEDVESIAEGLLLEEPEAWTEV